METTERTGTRYFESRDDAVEAFGRHVSQAKVDFFRAVGMDVVFGRREGAFFWDVDGRRFLNLHCNGGVFNMGHRHPVLVDALAGALEYWDVGNHHLISEARAAVASRIAALLPGDLNRAVFAPGGGEAIDVAIKMARGVTGQTGVVSAAGGYHGHTGLALSTGDAKYLDPFGPRLPGFTQVPFGDLDALDAAVDETCAAVVLEAVPATAGIVVPDSAYMQGVRRICDDRGALLVLDEVQTGLGRTGRLFAAQHWDLVPDFLVLGKGLSGGLVPIAATFYRDPHDRVFAPDPFVHVSTFGGAETACAVTLALVDLITADGFCERVEAAGARLQQGLEEVCAANPGMLEGVRRLGLMCGLVWRSPEIGLLASKALFDNGVFAVYANHDKRVTQVLPPLVVTDAEIDLAVRAVGAAAAALAGPEYTALAAALAPVPAEGA